MKKAELVKAAFGAALGVLALGLGAGNAAAECSSQASELIKKLEGSWRGNGTVTPIGGSRERISCRIRYSGSGARISQNISCAGTDYRFEAGANVTCNGDSISGSWSESVANNTGSASGRISGDRLNLEITGPNFQGRIGVQVTGRGHSFTINQFDPAAGRYVPVASVSLSR